jgi:hypothetical protein
MTRNLKALGLTFAAVLAMGAIVAQAAQAAPTVTPASYPAILTTSAVGNQKYVTNTGQELECTGVSGKSTIASAGSGDTVVTVENIAYSGCTAKVGAQTLPLTVNMTGCDYKFSGGAATVGEPNHFAGGSVVIECPLNVTGPDMTAYATAAKHAANEPLCTFTFWKGVNSGSITYTNTAGSPNDYDRKLVNIQTDVTRDGSILCGNPGTATWNGEVTVKAYEDLSGTEGSQIGVTISEGA